MKHVLSIVTVCAVGTSALGVTSYGPAPYTDSASSPYIPASFSWFYLEDFEDGALNTPGVSASGGFVLNPGPLTDSIDAGGRSYYAGGGGTTTIAFTFNAGVLGSLPTDVGIVWTDVGFLLNGNLGGPSDVIFEAFDASNVSIGSIGPIALGDGAFNGDQAEDRFFGMHNDAGILRFTISMPNSDDWEVDHLQYGLAVPGPGTVVGLGSIVMLARRTRRSTSGK